MTSWMLLAALLTTPAAAAPPPAPAQPVAPVTAIELRAPLFGEAFARTPVASVDGENIYLRELASLLEQAHSEMGMPAAGVKKQDVLKLVERLVELRIVAAEAKAVGLHELPDVKKALAGERGSASRAIVKERATAHVKADPEQSEAIFKSKVREVRIDSVLFKAPEEAEAFREAVAAGGDWKTLADEAIAAKKASSGELPEYVAPERMLPGVRGVLEGLKPGEVAKTPVITSRGAAVVRLLDERFPENAEARASAEALSRDANAQVALLEYYKALVKKLAKVNWQLLKQADFDSAKKFQAREKDPRILATIKGAAPVKVSDLALELRTQFFHGAERQADQKQINEKKEQFLNQLLFRRLLDREAELQKVFESPEFEERYGEFERSLLFSKFVERVLLPDIEVTDAEAKARYESNLSAFSTPPMLRLEAVAYQDAKSARSALEKAQRGAEFRWLVENTENQVPQEERNLEVGGRPVAVNRLPVELGRSLRDAHEGDYRLHVEGEQHWVVHVAGEVASSTRPFEDVRKDVVNTMYGERVDAALKAYVAKLRAVHQLEIYVTRMAS